MIQPVKLQPELSLPRALTLAVLTSDFEVDLMFLTMKAGLVTVTTVGWMAFGPTAMAAPLNYVTSFGSFGSGNGQFNGPFGVTVDSTGNVYVADTANNRIDEFNPSNFAASFTSFGTSGSGNGQFNNPSGVAVDSDSNVYVADSGNSRIDMFNPSNFTNTFTSFGTAGSSNAQFRGPDSLAVDVNGNVYVADTNNSRIVRFNPSNFASTFTSFDETSSRGGVFYGTFGVAVDLNDNVYVTPDGIEIYRFNPSNFDGTLTSFRLPIPPAGRPALEVLGLAVDVNGNVYATDLVDDAIDVFNPSDFTGTFTSFGTAGSGNGQFNIPTGVAVDSNGNVFVADSLNNRIVELNNGITPPLPVPEPSSVFGILALGGIGLASLFPLLGRHQAQAEPSSD